MIKQPEVYACLYVKEFPAQALLRLRPELHEKPCVVMEGEPPLQTVCSLNTKARLLHLAHGMTRVEVDTFPNVIVLTRSSEMEKSTRSILLECAGAFSPRVEERGEEAAFLCGIDISGTQGLFGTPATLARSLLQRVRSLGISARITVSSNFHTTVCLARGLPSSVSSRVVPHGEEAKALASLPVAVLRLNETQSETFALWGIHTLGLLADLPEKQLVARMGQDGRVVRQLARGERPHLFQPVEPPFALVETIELDSPIEILESLLFGVAVMLDQLILRAKARVLALASVTITLTLDGDTTHTRTVRPALPSTEKHLWLKLLHLDLEAHPPQASVLAVSLAAEPGSTSKVQLGLFSPQLPEASRLDVTLARIRALVGENCVGRAVLEDTHALDSFRMEPFTVPTDDNSAIAPRAPRASIRQLRPPEPTSVLLHNFQPIQFLYRERRYVVEHAYGPWLVGTNWWNQALWELEQWDLVACAEDGPILYCCLTRDRMRDQWQIAALYD